MRKFFLGGVAAAALLAGSPAFAQDVDFDWTGWYLGAHAGYGWGRDTNSYGKDVDGGSYDYAPEAGPYNHATGGGMFGGQLGANYEFTDHLVVGIETEGTWSGMEGSHTVKEDAHDPGDFIRVKSQNKWDGDVAGRFGFAWANTFIYGKLGATWGNFKYAATDDDFPTTNSPMKTLSTTNTRGGLLAGVGAEFAFDDNWTAKVEYDYMNYGTLTLPYPGRSNPTNLDNFYVHDTKNVIQFGINYLFGAGAPPPPPPPPAPPPPPPPPPAVKTFIVFFDFDKSNLTAEAQSVVSEAVKTAKETGSVRVMVTGHTDTVGSDAYNQALSVRRAESVKDEMQRQGMDGGSISIEGKSFHDPLVPTGPGVREPQNRRAVIDLGG